MEPMAATGSSTSHQKAEKRQLAIGNDVLKYVKDTDSALHAKWGDKFLEVPEAEVCTEYFFGMVATYIAQVAVIEPGRINAGQGYDNQTAEIFFNGLLFQTKERLKGSTSSQTQVRPSRA